jgi:hypothetical protein
MASNPIPLTGGRKIFPAREDLEVRSWNFFAQGLRGRGRRRGGGTFVTPVYHHWNGETPGELPSHSAKPSSMLAFEISNDHPLNWTHSAWGPTVATTDGLLVDLGGTLGSEDSGVRVVTLQRMNGTGLGFYEDGMNSSGADVYGDNYIRWQITEATNPDRWNHARVIGGVTDFAEDYTGHGQNNSTGNSWRYVFFEQLAAGNTTWSVYDEAGALQYTGSRAYQGTAGDFPIGLRYLQIIGFNAGTAVAQIWIGRSTDAWPTLPMTPISNL